VSLKQLVVDERYSDDVAVRAGKDIVAGWSQILLCGGSGRVYLGSGQSSSISFTLDRLRVLLCVI
jgi:hypothetical protein